MWPDGELAEEGFLVIRAALRQTRKIGLGQVVLGGRERIVALRPCGRGMVLETLRYADEVRDADRYFDEIEQIDLDEDQVSLAKELIDRKSVVSGKRVSVRVDLGGRRIIKKKKNTVVQKTTQ